MRTQLLQVATERSSAALEAIANNSHVATFSCDLMDFHVLSVVKVNIGNLFLAVRSYDGDSEGGGVVDIHAWHRGEKIPIFAHPGFENSESDANDTGLRRLFDQLQESGGLAPEVSYDHFRAFVVKLFLVDFDY